MKQIKALILLVILPSIFLSPQFLLLGCGNTSVDLDDGSTVDLGGSSDDPACDDTGDDLTAGETITVVLSGDVCNAPAYTDNSGETVSLILDCSDRTTENTDSDYVTVSCPGETAAYYCVDGIVYRNDGGAGTALFEDTEITCVGAEDAETIEEDELIIG